MKRRCNFYITIMENTGTINFNFFATETRLEPVGKCDQDQNIKVDDDIMGWLADIAKEANVGRSTIARKAIIFYRRFYSIHQQLLRYENMIRSMFKTLP